MAQHDYNVANQTFPATRTDLNNLFSAILSINSGTSAPSTTVAGMLWYDTTNSIIKQRNAADSGWIHLWAIGKQGLVDQSGSTVYAADSVGTDSYAITLTPAITAYAAGQVFRVKIGTANTGAGTLNVNGLGAVTLKKNYNEDLATGDLVANQIIEVVYDGTNFQLISPIVSLYRFPKGYLSGPAPYYASAASVTFPTGLRARNSADTANMELTGDVTVSLASSGAAGLDTGSEASNTWYYFYLIRKSSDGTCSVVASTTNEAVSGSITYPSGYDQKRQLPLAIRNDGSSNIIPFTIQNGWPSRPYVRLDVAKLYWNGSSYTVGTANVINNGTASSYTDVTCSSFAPAISRLCRILHTTTATTTWSQFRENGVSYEGFSGITSLGMTQSDIGLDTSQVFEYKRTTGSGGIYADVDGFYVTELS